VIDRASVENHTHPRRSGNNRLIAGGCGMCCEIRTCHPHPFTIQYSPSFSKPTKSIIVSVSKSSDMLTTNHELYQKWATLLEEGIKAGL
jgi:hypothetical protein